MHSGDREFMEGGSVVALDLGGAISTASVVVGGVVAVLGVVGSNCQ